MPFSSLSEPADVARAHAALDRAWSMLVEERKVEGERADAQRLMLATFIAGYAGIVDDEKELARRAVNRFLENA